MREYQTVIKSYESDKLIKCTCDKCGKVCEYKEFENYDSDKSFSIQIKCNYANNEYIYIDLCLECAKQLLNSLPSSEKIEDFKETITIWEED